MVLHPFTYRQVEVDSVLLHLFKSTWNLDGDENALYLHYGMRKQEKDYFLKTTDLWRTNSSNYIYFLLSKMSQEVFF